MEKGMMTNEHYKYAEGQVQEQPPYPPSPVKSNDQLMTMAATTSTTMTTTTTTVAAAAAAAAAAAPLGNLKKATVNIDATATTGSGSGKRRLTTRRWSAEEDEQLSQLVANSPDFHKISWSELASHMTNRSAKQCRERYINSLKPDAKKGLWSEEEDENIIRLQAVLGNQWSKIAAMLPGRSDNDVKNRWHSKMRSKAAKRTGVDHQYHEASGSANTTIYSSRNGDGNVMIHTAMQEQKRWKPITPLEEERSNGAMKSNMQLAISMDPNNSDCALPRGQANGTYGEVSGNEGIRSTTSLSETEVALCHQLLNLQRTLQTKQPDKQHEDYLVGHVQSMKSRDRSEKKNVGSSGLRHHDRVNKSSANAGTSNVAGTDDCDRRIGEVSNMITMPEMNSATSTDRKRSSSTKKTKAAAAAAGASSTSSSKSNPRRKQIEPSLNSPLIATSDPRAMSGIRHPGRHDCLIGRGGGTNHHPGNIKFRLIIDANKLAYKNSRREGKPQLAMQIVKVWRAMDPPGRFLRLNEQTGLWDDIGDEASRIKCSQTLREKKSSKLRLEDDVECVEGE